MHEIPQNVSEQNPNIYLAQLRRAFDSKDIGLLRAVVNGIQVYVHGTDKTPCSMLSEEDLRKLMETGAGMIYVGTGSHGQRIVIKNGEMYMPSSSNATIEKLTIVNKMNFRHLFNLSDTEDLLVRF